MKRLKAEELALKKRKAEEAAALAKAGKENMMELANGRPAKRTQTTPSKSPPRCSGGDRGTPLAQKRVRVRKPPPPMNQGPEFKAKAVHSP